MSLPKHMYETFVRATPAEVWAAITQPEFTRRYFHGASFETKLVAGSGHRYVSVDGSTAFDGTIEQVEPEHRLVMTWRALYDVALAEEPPSRVEWSLEPANDDGSITRVTLRHFDLGMSPQTANEAPRHWCGVLDSMKSLLETGQALGDLIIAQYPAQPNAHRQLAVEANGHAWELLAKDMLVVEEVDDLLERAYAAAYHWRRAADPSAPNQARAAWLLARCHTVAGYPDLALHHAKRCAHLTSAAPDVADFDRAYAHEALARALALGGRMEEASVEYGLAKDVPIAAQEDRTIVDGDLAAAPWFGLKPST